MIKKIKRWLLLHWRWYANMKLYVIADPTDNSITFSKDLFWLLDVMDEADAKVYVTQICNADTIQGKWYGILYGFCINPPITQDTQLADIQYNAKYHCVGFESLCPTVLRIFYDYKLNALQRVKLSVAPCKLENGMPYYVIFPPKSTRS